MIFSEGFNVDCIDILFQGKSTGWPGIKYYYYLIAFGKIFNEESEQSLIMILQFSFIQNAYNKIY